MYANLFFFGFFLQDFEKGIGATTEGAISIFEGLKNSTSSGNSYGDVMATVSVLSIMSGASGRVTLSDSLLPVSTSELVVVRSSSVMPPALYSLLPQNVIN